MGRILNSQDSASVDQAKIAWKEQWTPKIIRLAKLKEGMRIKEKMISLGINQDDDHDGKNTRKLIYKCKLYFAEANTLVALVLLAYLLPDSRTQADSDRIIQFCHVNTFCNVCQMCMTARHMSIETCSRCV